VWKNIVVSASSYVKPVSLLNASVTFPWIFSLPLESYNCLILIWLKMRYELVMQISLCVWGAPDCGVKVECSLTGSAGIIVSAEFWFLLDKYVLNNSIVLLNFR
jgi:hypothetical protein